MSAMISLTDEELRFVAELMDLICPNYDNGLDMAVLGLVDGIRDQDKLHDIAQSIYDKTVRFI